MRRCDSCNQNPATIHVTEIGHGSTEPAAAPQDSPAPAAGTQGPDGPPHAPVGNGGNGEENGSSSDLGAPPPGETVVHEQHLCEECAQALNLPHSPVKKTAQEIWKLLQLSAQRSRREAGVVCPDCGMSLAEFRQKGRMGCPKDYEIFGGHTRELLERIHGSTQHVGRGPGQDQAALERQQRMSELQRELDAAIRKEAYEQAARLRDELKALQKG
jgi:protein arginine kinase activator